jgi:hypothetical protein
VKLSPSLPQGGGMKRPKGGCGPRISSDAIVSWSRGCTRSPPLGVEACQANLYVKDRGGDRRGGGEREANKILFQNWPMSQDQNRRQYLC